MTSEAVHQRTAPAGHAPSLPAATDRPPRAVAVPYLPALAWDRVMLLLALVVGAALRLTDLGAVGLNSDEAVYSSQAASVAGNDNFTGIFPVVRAHPLLMQLLVSGFYKDGHPGSGGRYLAAAFGIGTIVVTYVAGRQLFGARAGALAALLLAVMPYHVTLSRQFMLDGPMTFFTTAALAALATAMNGGSRRWLVAAGALLGAGALCKETGLVLAVAAGLFLCVQPMVWRPVRHLAVAGALALGLAFTYPLLTAVAGGGRGGQSYLLWQLTRPPNHSLSFYPLTVGAAVGLLLLAVAAAGLTARRALTWREGLLLLWTLVPLLYFEVWPTKGFAYLLPVAPVVALLAARCIRLLAGTAGAPRRQVRVRVAAGLAAVCALSLAVPAVRAVSTAPVTGLAGAGGTPGGRETGQWVAANAPVGARFMTIGPSMSNLISYYSGRHAEGLSVSTNPLHRNPSYQAIVNPDAMLRSGAYQYIVWDAVSAGRSERFGNQATQLARRFGARTVHEERASDGTLLTVVYQVDVAHTRYSAQTPAPTVTVPQPNSGALYVGYGTALVVLLWCLGWAARVNRLVARLRGGT